jgi:hypothetical protein
MLSPVKRSTGDQKDLSHEKKEKEETLELEKDVRSKERKGGGVTWLRREGGRERQKVQLIHI